MRGNKSYVGRKTEGPKLGEIIARDLRKRATSSPRQSSASSPTPSREPDSIDLILTSKKLTDDGLRLVVDALREVLSPRRDDSYNGMLEYLDLSGNELTTSSLRILAEIIELSKYSLIDLDISGNFIQVKTEDEARDWDVFLTSFQNCFVLRRLDLSSNDLSGSRAFEILARAYSRQTPVDPTQLERLDDPDLLKESITDPELMHVSSRARAVSNADENKPVAIDAPMDNLFQGALLKRRQGLRAVPYIILMFTKMDDGGALWYSYILTQHYFPQHLLSPLKRGVAANLLHEYDTTTNCFGLVHLPNNDVEPSETGKRLLAQAETVRQELLVVDASSEESYVEINAMSSSKRRDSIDVSRAHRPRRKSTASKGSDRSSVFIAENASPNVQQLESLRKKIQRHIIEQRGIGDAALWTDALKTLIWTRKTQLIWPSSVLDEGKSTKYASKIEIRSAPPGEPILSITDVSNVRQHPEVVDHTDSRKYPGKIREQETVATPTRRIGASTGIEPFPRLEVPKSHGNQAVSLLTQYMLNAQKKAEPSTPLGASIAMSFVPDLVGHLPESIWHRIYCYACDMDPVLSEAQTNAVFAYARSRETLALERDWVHKGMSVQMWTVLERMGCLAYDVRS
ncbi:hypothetical protein K402DRAFT_459205 [Aulographum hederae CBS 113979]|uniref:Leucine rich repeat protein n=1 Tax=Aulographum hederae CBS 113979 TaxID=1176131 RepID=A0A6G1HGD4_9PEZI|nr:hypothetical protein K402DRAFT_459205 [Aulographum hederae CBS 113979]